jgi:hypothetical protein
MYKPSCRHTELWIFLAPVFAAISPYPKLVCFRKVAISLLRSIHVFLMCGGAMVVDVRRGGGERVALYAGYENFLNRTVG